MTSKTMSETNSLMANVDKSEYLALVGTFTILADAALVHFKGMSIITITSSTMMKNISIGNGLVFLCFFSLFVVLISPFSQWVTRYVMIELNAWKLFPNEIRNKHHRKDKIFISEFRAYAIRENNSVADTMIRKREQQKLSRYRLERYAFSFLLATLINILVSHSDVSSISWLIWNKITSADATIESLFITLTTFIVIMVTTWWGVVSGCCLISYPSDDYFYVPGHRIAAFEPEAPQPVPAITAHNTPPATPRHVD
ncbi:hypothetical protein [Ferrimonas balearica]|uniref:hypothetical protein n=1 Tax=Ferrimonas balearica TaxID=44012 RepID=UPI001C945805|nr:hypothetical protein [Ferrimonas balearica]MBY6223545.1 hypothetical protein [Ferrimonas balearica]